jgi:hypothetical protein
MKRTTLTLILGLLALSIVAGLWIEVAIANFFPGDILMIHSPMFRRVYATTSVPLSIVAIVANPTPEVVSITYCLDDCPNVTLTDLNEILRQPGHIDGSQFYAELVLENIAEGNHTLKAYSQDASGKQMSASVEFIIDTSYTSPLSVLSPQNKTYTTTEIPLTFICREDRTHDGNFRYAAYVLDGIGSDYINENITLTDLSLSNHTIHVTVWTKNDYFSENIQFTIKEPEPFPTTLVIASVSIVAVIGIGLFVYFKKQRRAQRAV